MTRCITPAERDLRNYATQKTYQLMRDVAQSYEIAGLSNELAAACLGALFLRLSATFAVAYHLNQEDFLTAAAESYNKALETEQKATGVRP